MREMIVVFFLIISFCAFSSKSMAEELRFESYTADFSNKAKDGSIRYSGKLYVSKNKQRWEETDFDVTGGPSSQIRIVRFDKEIEWVVLENSSTGKVYGEKYIDRSIPNAPEGSFVGMETINGQLTDRYDREQKYGGNMIDWYLHGTNVLLRHEHVFPNLRFITNFYNFKFGELSSDLFELPDGTTRKIDVGTHAV